MEKCSKPRGIKPRIPLTARYLSSWISQFSPGVTSSLYEWLAQMFHNSDWLTDWLENFGFEFSPGFRVDESDYFPHDPTFLTIEEVPTREVEYLIPPELPVRLPRSSLTEIDFLHIYCIGRGSRCEGGMWVVWVGVLLLYVINKTRPHDRGMTGSINDL